MHSKSIFKYLALIGLAAALSVLTVIFGAAPMRVLWRSYGRVWFWVGHVAVSAAMFAAGLTGYALVFLALSLLVGVYSEVEEHGSSVFNSGAIAILATLGTGAVAMGAWLYKAKANLLSEVKAHVAPLVEQMAAVNPGMQVSTDTLIRQLPSGVMIVLTMSLAIALVWERRILTWFRLPQGGVLLRDRLVGFKVPDLTVWLVMLAILGAFLQHGQAWLETLSVNALYVFVVLYFFQGLAVVAHAFRVFKVSPAWQGIWYVLIVLQLFLLTSFLGFADYWLDFRERLSRKPAETNKGF